MVFTELAQRRNLQFRVFPGWIAAKLQGKKKKGKNKRYIYIYVYIINLPEQ